MTYFDAAPVDEAYSSSEDRTEWIICSTFNNFDSSYQC